MSATPPPDPSSTTAAAAANATARLFSNPLPPQRVPQQPLLQPRPNPFQHRHHHQQQLYANQRLQTQPQSQPNKPQIQDPNQGILYPVASSGRGFLPRPIPQHHNSSSSARTNPNPFPYQVRPFGVPNSDPLNQAMHLVRPNNTNLHQSLLGSSGGAVPSIVRGVPVSTNPKRTRKEDEAKPEGEASSSSSSDKGDENGSSKRPLPDLNQPPAEALIFNVGHSLVENLSDPKQTPAHMNLPFSSTLMVAPSPSSHPDSNGIKDKRERSKDDNYVTIRDRKVKLSEGSSLYSLCRSWMKNSVSEENQPRYAESVKSLPKPLPAQVTDVNSEVNKEDEKEENAEDVESLTSKELLQRHIKRAKKVRARLREERLQRIARYKGRLALLLPPVVEQQFKNDSSASAN